MLKCQLLMLKLMFAYISYQGYSQTTDTQLFKSFYMIPSKQVSNFTGLIRKIVHVRVEKNRIKKILRWYVSKATLCYLKQFTTPVLTAVITLFAIE